jgi:class 3 adenylate cyclase
MASESITRKLTTIFEADVVGYSRLMADNEEATLATLRTYREFFESQIRKHGGRIFNTAGDAILAEFASAVESVRCAISIQEDLRVRNSELPENRQMWFRIGINVGDVMIEKDDLFGDGVNVAARLEGLADKGGICISGSTFDQVKNKLSIAFKDMGSQTVKNIPYPVAAYQLVPGQVSVNDQESQASKRGWPTLTTTNWAGIAIAGVSVLAVVTGVILWDFLPHGLASKHPFDGYWKVTVSSKSGCEDNSPASFPLNVTEGKINEPQQLRPKKGVISVNGQFSISATTRDGRPRGTLIGTITGNIGKGRMQGNRPGCTGIVTLVRLK